MKKSPPDSQQRDRLYADSQQAPDDFVFDEAVAQVFDDMIRRSVPGYAQVVAMTGLLAGHFAKADSVAYDLGCSSGAVSRAMRQFVQQPGFRIIAVDKSEAMLAHCHDLVQPGTSADRPPVELICADIRDITIHNASLVCLNFTLQFIPLAQREELIQRIFSGLNPGGALVLSEKIAFDNAGQQELISQLHLDYKRAHGYSALEISHKRSALENVLLAETLSTHRQRLQQAGFSLITVWHQSLNFASLLAVK
ncbi:MAG TPA: carboxy-S-adenosyl-L-methionine synthase CmoA [Gammaproteobacteria bacterium]|nr:carboxy-S-adenosyl-L-methionine synthase CmoA [Gammaproteobacteria bacterium]